MTEYDYNSITDKEFDDILEELLDECSASHWLHTIPSMYEAAKEYLNNEVLSRWEQDHQDYTPAPPLTPEEERHLEEAHRESEIARLKELGWLTEDGELTDAYYRAADIAYDTAKDR